MIFRLNTIELVLNNGTGEFQWDPAKLHSEGLKSYDSGDRVAICVAIYNLAVHSFLLNRLIVEL